MIDLTPLLQAVISLAAALITIYLIPWIKEKTTDTQQEYLRGMVHVAVYAAEKLYGAGHGAEKLVYAREWLKSKGFDLDPDTLTAEINAAIREMDLMDEAFVIQAEPEES